MRHELFNSMKAEVNVCVEVFLCLESVTVEVLCFDLFWCRIVSFVSGLLVSCLGISQRRCSVCMSFGGGFLGVGPAEVFVIVLVGWVVLGPRELIRVSKEVGAFLGGLRSAADDARSSLTRALEVEALEEEYNKTISAFQSGYRDGVSGKAVKDETGGDNAEEDSTSVENKSDEEQPTTHTDQTSEIDLESIAV